MKDHERLAEATEGELGGRRAARNRHLARQPGERQYCQYGGSRLTSTIVRNTSLAQRHRAALRRPTRCPGAISSPSMAPAVSAHGGSRRPARARASIGVGYQCVARGGADPLAHPVAQRSTRHRPPGSGESRRRAWKALRSRSRRPPAICERASRSDSQPEKSLRMLAIASAMPSITPMMLVLTPRTLARNSGKQVDDHLAGDVHEEAVRLTAQTLRGSPGYP